MLGRHGCEVVGSGAARCRDFKDHTNGRIKSGQILDNNTNSKHPSAAAQAESWRAHPVASVRALFQLEQERQLCSPEAASEAAVLSPATSQRARRRRASLGTPPRAVKSLWFPYVDARSPRTPHVALAAVRPHASPGACGKRPPARAATEAGLTVTPDAGSTLSSDHSPCLPRSPHRPAFCTKGASADFSAFGGSLGRSRGVSRVANVCCAWEGATDDFAAFGGSLMRSRGVSRVAYVCCVWERLCSALLAREAAHCVDEPQWLALAAASLAVHPAEPVPPLLSVPVRRSGGRQRRAARARHQASRHATLAIMERAIHETGEWVIVEVIDEETGETLALYGASDPMAISYMAGEAKWDYATCRLTVDC